MKREPGNIEVEEIHGLALSSHLEKRRVSRRMRQACEDRLQGMNFSVFIEEVNDTRKQPAYLEAAEQAGACLAVWARTSTGCLLGSDLAGAPGRPAEEIGQKVADRLIEDLSARACVDRFLADQLVPFLQARGGAVRLEGVNLPKRVLVFCDDEGNCHAFHNRCTHLGHRRLDPDVGKGTVQCCSVSKSTYDLQGQNVSGPAPKSITPFPVSHEGPRLKITVT